MHAHSPASFRLMMALTPKRLFLYLCISISLLRPYTLFSRSPLVNKTLFENACELEWVVLYFKEYAAIGRRPKSVFCEACHGKLVHSSLVFLFRTARVATVQWFGKKAGAYHTSFNHQRSTERPESNAKMYVNQRCEDWRENESTHYFMIISARNTGPSTIFRAPLSTTFRWRIFLKPTGID